MKLAEIGFAVFAGSGLLGVIVGIFLIFSSWGGNDPIDARIKIFDKGQEWYLEDRSTTNRAGLLWIGEELANELSRGNVTSEQAVAIETRLDWLLQTIGRYGMSDKDTNRRFRIETVVETRKAQQAQIDAINTKFCTTLSRVPLDEAGTETTVSEVVYEC